MRETSLQQVIDSARPRVLNDLPRYLQSRPESQSTRLVVEEGMRSSLTCPLVANGRPIGFLFFSSCRLQAYADEHVRVLGRIARHLSATVERALHIEDLGAKNAILEEEVERRRKAERTLSLAFERQKRPFQAGGTLPRDALSYVERNADRELFDGLRDGELCYVLTSRQMGKSSLMVRTARRLQEMQVAVATLDLTAIGQVVLVEQWYAGLISQIGWQLNLEAELESYWQRGEQLAPAQRLFGALRDVVLFQTRGAVVLFVDEIDAVRSLPFSTDEFFAALRECHNRRAGDDRLSRLGFCLLGASSPHDLVTNPLITPFNIGRRVHLDDFTPAEAWPLAQGLSRTPEVADELIRRILYWTNGHPYLTQRLCGEVVADPTVQTAATLDIACERIFLSGRSREEDANLLYVREALLRSPAFRDLLALYGSILRGESNAAGWPDPTVGELEQCGLVVTGSAGLRVRNRIYQQVFNEAWISRQLSRTG